MRQEKGAIKRNIGEQKKKNNWKFKYDSRNFQFQ